MKNEQYLVDAIVSLKNCGVIVASGSDPGGWCSGAAGDLITNDLLAAADSQ